MLNRVTRSTNITQHIWKIHRRNVRIAALSAEQQINQIPNTVSYRFIDKDGGTKRFYREVFIEPIKVPHTPTQHEAITGGDDALVQGDYEYHLNIMPRSPAAPEPSQFSKYSYLIKLDDRAVILQGLPILIDHFDLAMMIASEFEAQAEYIRLESMPISEIAINLIERDARTNAVPSDIRRRAYSQSVLSHFENDLLLIAENQRFYDTKFYQRHWIPIIDWFNNTFETNLELQYMLMKGEKDKIDEFETAMDVQNIFDMDPDDVMDKYQSTEIAHTVEQLQNNIKSIKEAQTNNTPNYGKIRKFLNTLDDTRLWMVDELIQYCYSPIIAMAVVTNAVSIEKVLKAIECPELDVSMIVPNEEHLKLNQTQLKIAACRCFLDVYDKMYPLTNPVRNVYEEPMIKTQMSNSYSHQPRSSNHNNRVSPNHSNRPRKQSRNHRHVDVPLNHDFSNLVLKDGSDSRPLWVCPTGHIFLETFSPFYEAAYDFLIAIAEPVCRPELIHEYKITKYSLYAAASVGLQTDDLIAGLQKLSKNELDTQLIDWIQEKTRKCGKLRMILKSGRYFLESSDSAVLTYLLTENNAIYSARLKTDDFEYNPAGYITNITQMDNDEKLEIDNLLNKAKDDTTGENEIDIVDIGGGDEAHIPSFAFEIREAALESVKQAAQEMQYPCVEEYDFRNDPSSSKLDITLKAIARHRPYQEKCLSKMFGNGRARSGLIVLPCGAGKTLVGVTAIATVKKSAIIFANTTVSVHQWCQQIMHWSSIDRKCVIEFSSQNKAALPSRDKACILVTTYHMLGHSGRRSKEAQIVMDEITSREWGLLVLDEVHVAPAQTFRKCTSLIRSKCKLGLTATLLREDDKIGDLFYLIGPKLYEANWLDLQKNGYLARVQCIEVWCEMSEDFYNEYLFNEENNKRYSQILSDFNPNKFRSMQYLIRCHEERGDKVLVFSDNIPLLKHCAKLLCKPFIYGKTGDQERKYWLHNFNHTQSTNCLFISSVGDTSLDLPDVNVVIQISSHYGSRRQEAQRLGRILRPKPRQGDEFNAFFYTLVSKDTVDMVYATKRQRFLVDQGYSFHVITNLVNEMTPNLKYSTPSERRELLMQVMTLIKSGSKVQEQIEKELSVRPNGGDDDDDTNVIRKSRPLSALSDGSGLRYSEFSQTSHLASATGLLANKATKRGKKRKANTKFFQKAAKERKTLNERRKLYLPH